MSFVNKKKFSVVFILKSVDFYKNSCLHNQIEFQKYIQIQLVFYVFNRVQQMFSTHCQHHCVYRKIKKIITETEQDALAQMGKIMKLV